MAIGIIYDGSNRVIDFNINADTLDYLDRPNSIVFYDGNSDDQKRSSIINLLMNVPIKYLKVFAGDLLEMDQTEKNAVDLALLTALDLEIRSRAKSSYDGFLDLPLALRAFASITVDEINILRQWITSFKTQVSLATTLADLKTRVAGLPTVNDRTLSQLKTAIQSRIDDHSVDEKG